MGRLTRFQNTLKHHIRQHPAQSFVEFALALPILLLLMFGIIEFGRLMQAWLALENGARFAVRYAVTGQYNLEYCDEAGIALGLTDLDNADHKIDCIIPEAYPDGPNKDVKIPDFDLKTMELQDFARLPSIRENGLAGASGIALDEQPAVSGDYLGYLDNAYDVNGNVLSQLFRGNPSAPGYFGISTCSSHADVLTFVRFNPNGFWYDEDPADAIPPVETDANRFPIYCEEIDTPTDTLLRYVDDAGGPGDRVRVILTYRHELITPFLSNWWPTLKLTTSREGLVEKFRTSRVTGLTGGISMAATKSFTPSETFTPSDTLEATLTPSYTFTATYTPTLTSTSTPVQATCPNTGSILRQWWAGVSGSAVSDLVGNVNFPYYPTDKDNPTNYQGPTNWGSQYGQRFRGYICAPYDGWYKFWIVSDNQSNLYLSSDTNPLNLNLTPIAYVNDAAGPLDWDDNNVKTTDEIYLYAGQEYYTEALHKEAWDNDNIAVGWKGPNDLNTSKPQVIAGKYLRPFVPDAIPVPETCANNGSLLRQRWTGISGNPVTNLTSNVRYPGNASSWEYFGPFEVDSNEDNFGERWRGYICPPFDGQYTFYIASDDYSELYLSTDANPLNKVQIASVTGWTTLHDYTEYASQKSTTRTLLGGTLYYVEVLWKEGTGGDNLSVAWTGPYLNPVPAYIDSQYLVPIEAEATLTYTPSNTPTRTFTPSQTFTPSRTFTPSQTFTSTNTRTSTFTPSNTLTPSKTLTPSQTFTRTFTATNTNTLTPSNTPTSTNTYTPSNTATNTATNTNTATRTNTFTPSVTLTPSKTLTPTVTKTPTTYISPTIWGGG